MNDLLSVLLSYVQIYKYLGIFVITFLGAFALPLPSGSVISAAAAFAVQGYMNFYLVVLVGIAGNIAGDNTGYWLTRWYGISVVHKLRLGKFFKQERLTYARKLLEDYPILSIYFSRFFTAIAPAVNVVAGLTRLSFRKYFLFESLGEVSEVVFFAFIGFIFGNNWEYFSQLSNKFWILSVGGMVLSVMLWKVILKKR